MIEGSGQLDRVCMLSVFRGWVGVKKNCGCKQTSDKEIDGVDTQKVLDRRTRSARMPTNRHQGEINEWNDPVRGLKAAPMYIAGGPVRPTYAASCVSPTWLLS